MADTRDDWEREVALWTDSFDTKQATTLGGQKSQSSSTSVRRWPLSSKGGAREEYWCGDSASGLVRRVPTRIAAKLLEMLVSSMRRKAGSESFAAYGIRFNKCYRELGQLLKRLDITLDAGKLFHPVIRGILLLENNGLNGSEVSAVLATQENSYGYEAVMSGWRNSGRIIDSSSESATRRKALKYLPTTMSRESGSIQRRKD